ncbi:hypothetical protein SNOG_06059 [Parastagonospora nodorum SN15]|uniref:FAD-binding PCMH-type domain-containing protein n=1 Tax=Phaeosphaeria nodorum (strain SN15 / ATCC MYA-4574 / FGSC 10173) TaxID=321614 RepID=Q0UQA5_PHANO|nr:hypothetical protein SNOG_06059 [Parastagonospora nodorum SN15]EAT87123.2 hypothetical protein SNOG_06059 [Parastagonospora nodorum SN15]
MGASTLITLFLLTRVFAVDFDWEREQLTEDEALTNKAYCFGSANAAPTEECRSIPGDGDWPCVEDWSAFNKTLGGVLLKPRPLASVCYTGEDYNEQKCAQLKQSWARMNLQPNKYHVSMGIRKQLYTNIAAKFYLHPRRLASLAVNFARNHNIRLVIKNSGHDFNGKSIGGNSLSIWTQSLKGMTYEAEYTSPMGEYTGRAIKYSAGTQAYEGSALMSQKNMSMIVAGGSTVGIAGGFLQGGGHSSFTSYYGLAADNVLAMTAVIADGRIVEMHNGLNEDLFWAFRGGGGVFVGTFGIVTSVVVKAFPKTPVVTGNIRFSTKPDRGSNNSISTETFWAGMKAYWTQATSICDAGGLGYSFIYPEGSPQGLTFTVRISLPNKSLAQYRTFIQPLLSDLNTLGVKIPDPTLKRSINFYTQ